MEDDLQIRSTDLQIRSNTYLLVRVRDYLKVDGVGMMV